MPITKNICDQLSDQEIVQRSLANVSFFACLFDRYEPILLRYIRRLSMVSDEEAEDILQDSFIKIWKNLHGFDPSLKLSSWLYRIVHNQTISYWRKKKSFGKDNTISLDETLFLSEPDETIPLEELEQSNHQLLESLNKLSVNYRDILILRFFEKLSYIEISDVLKIPEGTVATRINRAKKALLTAYTKT